jgi:hypothetical protein
MEIYMNHVKMFETRKEARNAAQKITGFYVMVVKYWNNFYAVRCNGFSYLRINGEIE